MKVLVYGFGPYMNYKENITETIVKKLKSVSKQLFDVKFGKNQFINAVKDFDVIIGLGQHPRSKKLRIERKAVNLKWKSRKETPKPIFKDKPQQSFVTLKIKKDKDSWLSYDAGKYVCNYSM